MRHARLLIPLLVLATVLVDLAAAVMIAPIRSGGTVALWMVFLSLPMSQVGLLSAWAALGKAPAPWRAVGLVLPLALWSKVMGTLLGGPGSLSATEESSQWTFYLLMEALATVALLGTARAAGLQLTGVDEAAHPADPRTPRRFQFSLGRLFSWLTAAALVLAGLGYTFHLGRLGLRSRDFRSMTIIAAMNVILLSAALYVMLGRGRRFVRWLVGLAALVAAAGLLWLHSDVVPVGLIIGTGAVWLLGSLAVVRVAGYRLSWRRLSGPPQPPNED